VRISEALAFEEQDIHRSDRALVVRHGKGDKLRLVVMDDWGWSELDRWVELRAELPPGALIPVIRGQHAGQPMSATDARRQMRDLQHRAGVRRRIRPHQLRHGFAVENFKEGVNLHALQKQLGHAHLGVTEIYLRGIDPLTLLQPFGERRPPMVGLPPPH
jgi:site-specific recombinase XerD